MKNGWYHLICGGKEGWYRYVDGEWIVPDRLKVYFETHEIAYKELCHEWDDEEVECPDCGMTESKKDLLIDSKEANIWYCDTCDKWLDRSQWITRHK